MLNSTHMIPVETEGYTVSKNSFGTLQIFCLSLMGFTILLTFAFAVWTFIHRKSRVLCLHQPEFLLAICFGLILWSTAVIPQSLDDSVLSQKGCDRACNAYEWLTQLGYSMCLAALYAKLWRINRIFSCGSFRRVKVKVKDVLLPFLALITISFGLLLSWILTDPLEWVRMNSLSSDQDRIWTNVGVCVTGTTGDTLRLVIDVFNFVALLLVCREAWKARTVSSELQQSRYFGLIIYNWIQLALIRDGVNWIVDDNEASTKYFITVVVHLAQIISMLLIIFFPIVLQFLDQQDISKLNIAGSPPKTPGGTIHISGLESTTPTTSAPTNAGEIQELRAALEECRAHLRDEKMKVKMLEERNHQFENSDSERLEA